jgi:hypothetical protein
LEMDMMGGMGTYDFKREGRVERGVST